MRNHKIYEIKSSYDNKLEGMNEGDPALDYCKELLNKFLEDKL